MPKSKVIKEAKTNLIKIGRTIYLRIPYEIIEDSAFPFPRQSAAAKEDLLILDHPLILKMLKDKLIVEEE